MTIKNNLYAIILCTHNQQLLQDLKIREQLAGKNIPSRRPKL